MTRAPRCPFFSFRRAVPFEEDERDPAIWFFDHSYHEQMYRMHRRINGAPPPPAGRPAEATHNNSASTRASASRARAAKETVVGWYSTGPKVKEARASAPRGARQKTY